MNTSDKLTNREFLKVCIPIILSTITMPLLGAVDMAVVGQLSNAVFIGGISIGVTIFNTIYWVFGFLRVITTGYSAQSSSSNINKRKLEAFMHPIIMALFIGVLIVILQKPIWNIFINMLSPESGVIEQAKLYYYILIWGAPFVLLNYVIMGWLMGQSKVKLSVIMQIIGNLVNIILDILFVRVFNLNVGGVAIATLISQIITFFIGIISINNCKIIRKNEILNKDLWNLRDIVSKMNSSFDFIIRTGCLLLVNNIFMAKCAELGTIILAANSIILQFESFIAYVFEGLANAASIFAGRAKGYKSKNMLKDVIKKTSQWTIVFAIILTIIYAMFRGKLVYIFTNIEEVIMAVNIYGGWLLIYPIMTSFGLSLYGIFTGIIYTKAIKYSTILATIIFISQCYILIPILGNNGLWISFIIYYFGRTIFLLPFIRGLFKRIE